MRNKIIPYNPNLRQLSRELRKNSTLSEVLLWKEIKNRKLGPQFHRQVPIDEFIVDFYCHEIMLAIEIDGSSHDHPQQFHSDKERQQRLEGFGVHFIRLTDEDIKQNMEGVILFLEQKINEIQF